MQKTGMHDKEFQKLQDALLHRIMSSKIPEEREQLLNLQRRLLRQQRMKQATIMQKRGDRKEML